MDDEKARIQAMMQRRVEELLKGTARLVRPNAGDLEKTGGCSGVLVDRGSKRATLFTARHSFDEPGEWNLEVDVPAEFQGVMIPLPGGHRQQLDPALDVAWWDINLETAIEKIKADPALEGVTLSLPLRPATVARPSMETWFSFAAYNRAGAFGPIPRFGGLYGLERKPAYEIAMEFGGVVEKNGLYRFNLARHHQGDPYYRGASGGPIFDDEGRLVSLVVSGCENEDLIYGFPLADHAPQLGLVVVP